MDQPNMSIENVKYEPLPSSIKINNDKFIFYAHQYEILNDHLSKTLIVFNNLINNDVIVNFHKSLQGEGFINLDFKSFTEIIQDFVFFHDYGKLSFNFQLNRLNKNIPIIHKEQEDFINKYWNLAFVKELDPNHSLTGSILFLSKYINIDKVNKPFILLLSYIIYGHHSKLKDVYFENEFAYSLKNNTELTYKLLLMYLGIASSKELNTSFSVKNMQDFQKNNGATFTRDKFKNSSTVSFFYNYIYSLLITSDVIASSKPDLTVKEFNSKTFTNNISSKLLKRMQNSFYNVSYNTNWENHVKQVENINDLRLKMLQEASTNLSKSLKNKPSNRVFFLKMPTGGGKTNTSMKLAIDIISKTNANRIIYSMPFINIIEQNYDRIRDDYGLSEEDSEIRKIYSATETIFSNKSDEDKSRIILNDQFFNYPVICTTFVSLFNTLINSYKSNKYMLNSLSNSVIILDEIQSLPLKNWNSLYYLINELALNYNTYFIIMSATLPEFNDLKLDTSSKISYSTDNLIENPSFYFNHPLFNRTEIQDFQILNIENEDFIKYYITKIKENFDKGYNKGLIVLNTIKTSRLIYEELYKYREDLNFSIDLLNSSLLSQNKSTIIGKINNPQKDDDSNYILVSTQSIEAGVDVSFDFVFRDFATLDSIEQVRGRCNRNGELYEKYDNYNQKGNIYLTNIQDSHNKSYYEYIYDDKEKSTRIKETKNIIKNQNYDYNDIINYYKHVSKDINNLNDSNEDKFILTDRENIINWNQLKYSKLIDKKTGIQIIDDSLSQYSIFVETELPITYDLELTKTIETMSLNEIQDLYKKEKDYFLFTYSEIKYLKEKDQDFIIKNCISGEKILKFYENQLEILENENYLKYKILKKEFSSILNKFIFNISLSNEELKSEVEDDLNHLSYFYIIPKNMIGDTENDLYSLNKGFNYEPISTYFG